MDASFDEDEEPKLGEGMRGHGPPLTSYLMGQLEGVCDGFRLSSPGRWSPHCRRDSSDCDSSRFVEELENELESLLRRSLDIEQLASSFTKGKIVTCPFKPELIQEGRDTIFKALDSVGASLPVRERPCGQPLALPRWRSCCSMPGILTTGLSSPLPPLSQKAFGLVSG